MAIDKENKRVIYKISELIYEMYLKDLKSGNIIKEPIKYYGKICKKRNPIRNNDDSTLFNYGK